MKKIILFPLCYLLLNCITEEVLATQIENEKSSISFDIQLLDWQMADAQLPKYSKFTVMDVETGKYFQVQRRAGSQHADVQPLTVEDTKIMKKIYNGHWSWKRRAIIIMTGDQWLAASMHGMPHGAGALSNDFPGHFCIHFLGSTTHKTDKMDLSHKLMIYKAAGKLTEYLDQLNPNDVVKAYVAGIKEQDKGIINHLSINNMDLVNQLGSIENVKLIRLNEVEKQNYESNFSIETELNWHIYTSNSSQKLTSKIILIRASMLEPWKVMISNNHLLELTK